MLQARDASCVQALEPRQQVAEQAELMHERERGRRRSRCGDRGLGINGSVADEPDLLLALSFCRPRPPLDMLAFVRVVMSETVLVDVRLAVAVVVDAWASRVEFLEQHGCRGENAHENRIGDMWMWRMRGRKCSLLEILLDKGVGRHALRFASRHNRDRLLPRCFVAGGHV